MDNSPPSSLERQIDSFLEHFKRSASKAMEAEWCSIGGINSSAATATSSAAAADSAMSSSSQQQMQHQQQHQHLVQGRHVTQDNSVAVGSRPHPLMQKTKSRSSCLELNKMQELNVNARQLRYFEKNHIHSLIPQTQLGILAEFEYLIKQWQIQKGYTTNTALGNAHIPEVNGNVKSVLARGIQTDARTFQSIGINTLPLELNELAAPQEILNDGQQELFNVLTLEEEPTQHVSLAEPKRKDHEIYESLRNTPVKDELAATEVNTLPVELIEFAAPSEMMSDGQQELFSVITVDEESRQRVTNAESTTRGPEIYLLEDIIPAALGRTKNNYRRKKLLNEGDRRLLAGSIVNYFESSNIKLVSTVMENLAEQITLHFPTESKKAWYDRHKSRGRGRLYMKFYNSHRSNNTFRNCNKKRKLLPSPDETASAGDNSHLPCITYTNDADETTGSSLMDEIILTDQDEGSKMVQSWLKSHKCEDFAEIMQMWKDTLDYRLMQLQQLSDLDGVKDVLENWPSYKLERGYELLSMDFEQMHSHSMAIFRSRWLVYQQAIVTLFESAVKDSNCRNILDQYKALQDSLNEDSNSCILVYLLHAVTKPYRVFKTATGSVRYCISDSQHTVCRLIQHQSEMEDYQEPYPCIFVVGDKLLNIRECYVCFWHIRYRLSFVDCLIACMQLYVVFQLDDPLPSLHFWQFVRGYLFDIHKEKDRPYVIMENVIQYLETTGKSSNS